ncbi:hypothetical protein [Caballeronia sp. J97]|uniref:hypothetical protein n=1 Tax=Caballeronia sp. J97 TaxID=2805429 RepID=UPI002AB1F735|nr:hypothetical protein [Caballeronia sp. J97]
MLAQVIEKGPHLHCSAADFLRITFAEKVQRRPEKKISRMKFVVERSHALE